MVVRIQPGVSSFEPDRWLDAHPISIWKYEKGNLKFASLADFEQVKSNGNVYIFVFLIQKIGENEAFVDVATFYPGGGGEASHCLFKYINQNWSEENIDTYINWD